MAQLPAASPPAPLPRLPNAAPLPSRSLPRATPPASHRTRRPLPSHLPAPRAEAPPLRFPALHPAATVPHDCPASPLLTRSLLPAAPARRAPHLANPAPRYLSAIRPPAHWAAARPPGVANRHRAVAPVRAPE